MKSSRISIPLLVLILAASAGCTSGSGTQPGGQGSGVLDLATMLTGRWQAEGSDLRLDISTTGTATSGQVFNLFASASGQVGSRSVSERAVLHLEHGGGDVEVSVIPRDPTVTPLSPDATEVSPAELRAACTFTLAPTRNGYSGETRGGETCARAIQGAVGQWRIEVTPETLRLSSGADQQLVFRKSG